MFSFLAAVTHTSGCGKQQMCLDRQVSGPSSEEPAFKPPLLLASDGQAGGSILTGTALIERSTQPSAAKNSADRHSREEARRLHQPFEVQPAGEVLRQRVVAVVRGGGCEREDR